MDSAVIVAIVFGSVFGLPLLTAYLVKKAKMDHLERMARLQTQDYATEEVQALRQEVAELRDRVNALMIAVDDRPPVTRFEVDQHL